MELVVTDTNIFIDLYSADLLDAFFYLPFEIHTVEFVLEEFKDEEQRKSLDKFVNEGKLKVRHFDAHEVEKIGELMNDAGGNVSFVDCSALMHAIDLNCTLLTGDRQLKNKATERNVEVRGVLYVFDLMVEKNLLNKNCAISRLKELQAKNVRMPKKTIAELIEKWNKLSN